MSKVLTKDSLFYFGGYDLTGDTTGLEVTMGAAVLDPTVFNDAAERALAGRRSDAVQHDGLFDGAAGQIDAALDALISTTPVFTFAVGGSQGDRTYSGLVLHLARKMGGDLNGLILARLQGGADGRIDPGRLILPSTAVNSSGRQSSYDNGASSSNGAVGFLHVFASDGTADIAVQESSDDGAGDAFADVITFTQISSGRSSERVAVTGTIERYLAVNVSLGTATSITIAVAVARL